VINCGTIVVHLPNLTIDFVKIIIGNVVRSFIDVLLTGIMIRSLYSDHLRQQVLPEWPSGCARKLSTDLVIWYMVGMLGPSDADRAPISRSWYYTGGITIAPMLTFILK